MQFADNTHAADDVIERYSMGRLSDPALSEFEEHLLVCEHCRARLTREDDFTSGIRAAAGEVGALKQRSPRKWTLPRPVLVLSLAALALVVVVGTGWPRHSTSPAAMILLQATRGAGDLRVTAPAGKPIILVLDSTDLQPFPSYRVEVVDATGRSAFRSAAAPDNNKLRASLTQGLSGGAYFVRVYSPTQELLREYALAVL
jgi:hypothetical protein